jgi:hypothetical protein
MNKNFYDELSYYCTPYIYEKFEYTLTNKQKYLNTIADSVYKYQLITHLPLIDFIYVFNKLEGKDIMIIFRQLCINGYEKKIKYVCYNVEFYNSYGFDEEIIKYVIPHRNKGLIYFLMEYFQCEQLINFNEIFQKITLYNNLCLDVFIHQLIHLNDIEVYNYIKQAIHTDRYKIFAYLIDLFKLDKEKNKKNWKSYLVDISCICIDKNKLQFLEYIHKINPLNTFFSGLTCINKIKSFQMYKYLRKKVHKKEMFDRRFLYSMIKKRNKHLIQKCIKLVPFSICQCNHKAIHLSTGSIKQFLTDIHPCGKKITIQEQTPFDKVINNVNLFTSNLNLPE